LILVAKVFISYSRGSQNIARILSRDIEELGHTVWWDQELSGGHVWWDRILAMIRDCTAFVFVLDEEAVKSTACMSEFRYAEALAKPVLPVLVSRSPSTNLLPTALAKIQFIDYRSQDRPAAFRLARALSDIPSSQPLPAPLPKPPEAPISPVVFLTERVRTASALTDIQQRDLVTDLRQSFHNPQTAADARVLLEDFRKRQDLLATIAHEVDVLLASKNPSRSRRWRLDQIFTWNRFLLAAATLGLIVVGWLVVRPSDVNVSYRPLKGLPAGAGIMSLTAVLASDGPEVEGPKWSVYEAQPDALGNRKGVTTGYETKQRFTLPAGQYKLTVEKGVATATQDLEIRAGMVTAAKVVLNAGIVDLTAVLASDGPAVESPKWSVYEAQPDALGNRKGVTTGYETKQRFTLPAGQYKLTVEKGAATATQDLKVQPGKRIEMKLVLAH
jgi:TIR domain